MCTVFRYSSEQRTLSFSKVAEITKLPENEVNINSRFIIIDSYFFNLGWIVIDEIIIIETY